MATNSKNSRAVVVYLDDDEHQFHMFKMLLRSVQLINAKDTDIVVFYAPKYEAMFKDYKATIMGNNGAGLILKMMVAPAVQYKAFQNYKYINSIACLIGQEWLLEYDYLLRTDVDTLLTPKWNTTYPNYFTAGAGFYNNDTNIKQQLKKVMARLKLPQRKDYTYNIGSTWYGASRQVFDAAVLASSVTKELLTVEFKDFTGAWPGFYREVCSMYAGEIAVNYLVEKFTIDPANFDFESTSSDAVHQHTHIHCWHTTKPFSKHAFFDGKYKDTDVKKLDKNIIHQYCLFCALTAEV